MSETEYSSIENDPATNASYIPHHQPSTTSKRPRLTAAYSRARTSYRQTSVYARENLISAKLQYEDARDFTRRTNWKQATKDFAHNSIPWTKNTFWPLAKYFLQHLFILAIPVAFLVCLCYIAFIPAHTFTGTDTCLPDGSFSIAGEGGWSNGAWSAWSIDGVFQITLGFGHNRFTVVKLIDVIWDIVIGRGLQAIFAAACYLVFTQSLQKSMEVSPVAYGTFEALTFNQASISQALKLIRNLSTNQGISGKVQVAWMIFASMFVVAFSTLASAMSGYSAQLDAMFTIPDQNMSIALSDLKLVPFVIHDFWRLDLTSPYIAANGTLDFYPESDVCSDQTINTWNNNGTIAVNFTGVPEECHLMLGTNYYTLVYGLNGTTNNASEFYMGNNPTKLSPPTLHITSTFLRDMYQQDEEDEEDSTPSGQYTGLAYNSYLYNDWTNAQFIYQNTTYTYADIQANGQCVQASPPGYSWGFSFILLFVTALLTTIWSIGMYIMWLDAHLHSRYNRAGRRMGPFRAALDLAKALHKDMGEDAAEHLSNSEIKDLLKRGMNGHVIGYELLDLPGSGEKELPLTRWETFKIWHRFHGWGTWTWKQRILRVIIPVMTIMLIVVLSTTLSERRRAYDDD